MSVRNAILGLLAQQPRHGYELRAAFEALIGGDDIWNVKPAQIYTTLTRLEEAGLVHRDGVEQDGGPEKRIYSLTTSGRHELAEWFVTGVAAEHTRDEFFVKLMVSLYSEEIDPYQVIRAQRGRLYRDLHALRMPAANWRKSFCWTSRLCIWKPTCVGSICWRRGWTTFAANRCRSRKSSRAGGRGNHRVIVNIVLEEGRHSCLPHVKENSCLLYLLLISPKSMAPATRP